MFKIDGLNTVNAMPARTALGASPGWFAQAAGAGAGTVVTGEYLNMWQAEFLSVLAAAGIAPNKAADNQILLAIQAIAAGLSGWSTGDVKPTYKQVADAGWVLMNDGTIGKTGSAATTRANDDTLSLYTLFWGFDPADVPLSGGARGANAAADFAAGRLLTLPKALGRSLSLAGAGAGLTARILGRALGAETHNHGGGVPAHDYLQVQPVGTSGAQTAASHPAHTHAIAADSSMPPVTYLNAMVKL